ncbi:hypothetical protein [Flavobacterium sp. HNIBRBA15423]|uniref:hypothetical protein n=1 Tax=Flavobacterium sp. HNIBRBA15423 TaxID=3458683 RepID=UPI004043D7B8
MKSKQINFYIVPKDFNLINDFLKKNQCSIYVNNYIIKKKNPIYKLPNQEEEIFQVYLSSDKFENEIHIIEKGEMSYFDVFKSNFVEFTLGGFYPYDETLLQRARLYVITDYYGNDYLITKDTVFIEWSNKLIKDFKKEFLKRFEEDKSVLYSKNAIEWIKENQAIYINAGNQWKSKK